MRSATKLLQSSRYGYRERLMDELPKEVAVLFENNPDLRRLLPNPLLVNDSGFLTSVAHHFNRGLDSTRADDLYRISFKRDSSRELMTIQSGELTGLLTTTCVEKGRISNVAGLEKVSGSVYGPILPSLLSVAIFRSLKNELSYISHIATEIRNHQIQADQARFERITEVIVDSFECIPMVSIDRGLRDIHLSRVIRSNDDCYELYISQRSGFRELLTSWPGGYDVYYESNAYYNPSRLDVKEFLDRQVMGHPVFAVFERLVAGRVCEILLSGNYSQTNIQRHRRLLCKAIDELQNCLGDVFRTLSNGSAQLENAIDNRDLTGRERDDKVAFLNQHNTGVNLLKKKLFDALNHKIGSLDILDRIAMKEEFNLYVINGSLLINDDGVEANKG